MTNADDEQLHQLTEHMRMDLSSFLISELHTNIDPTWRLSKLLVNMGEYDKAITTYEMILNKVTSENNLQIVQATHYQLAELLMLYKNDWEGARVHLKQMFSMATDDAKVVVDDARGDWITVFSMVKDLLTPEHINEDEFHSVMAELLSKVITLFFDYSLKPLSPLDYQLIVDRCNYIGFVRKKQGK